MIFKAVCLKILKFTMINKILIYNLDKKILVNLQWKNWYNIFTCALICLLMKHSKDLLKQQKYVAFI